MANTYIHTLPDSLEVLDPAAYTILDSKNLFDEYTTSRLSLSSLSDFVNDAYILTEEHLATKRATSWVNSNSSTLNVNSLIIDNSFNIENTIPIKIFDNKNERSENLISNLNEGNLADIHLSFINSSTGSSFKIGVLGINYTQSNLTLENGKNLNYIFSEEKPLIIGSVGVEKDVILFTDGPFAGNERIVLKANNTGFVGIKTTDPNTDLTVNGSISSNSFIYDKNGNSDSWNQSSSFVLDSSSRQTEVTSLLEQISSNLVFRTGSLITGTLNTTQTLTSFFNLDDFVSRRYVDAVLLQSNISGNFIPALYYTKAEVESLLENPYSVYSHVNLNSSLDLESRIFVNNNSSIFLDLNTVVGQTSANWESVYSYVNQASSAEEDQTEVTNFVISNSTNLLEVNTFVNNNSSSLIDLYTFTSTDSAFNSEVQTYVSSNSSQINQNNILLQNNSTLWSEAYTVVETYSGSNIDTTTTVNSNSSSWSESYTIYSNNSGTYTTYNYVDTNFVPLTGGNMSGNLFIPQLGIGNTVVVAGTLGTLSRKMEIFDINGNSLGFIPVYGTID